MPVLEPGLVDALSELPTEVAAEIMVNFPAVAHFHKDGDELWYVGTLHDERNDSLVFELLRRAEFQ